MPVQLEPRRLAGLPQKMLPARRKVVIAGDVVPAGQQPINDVAADESGRAGDHDSHVRAADTSRKYRLRDKRIRNRSITLRTLPLNSCRRLSPSSRQRIGDFFYLVSEP